MRHVENGAVQGEMVSRSGEDPLWAESAGWVGRQSHNACLTRRSAVPSVRKLSTCSSPGNKSQRVPLASCHLHRSTLPQTRINMSYQGFGGCVELLCLFVCQLVSVYAGVTGPRNHHGHFTGTGAGSDTAGRLAVRGGGFVVKALLLFLHGRSDLLLEPGCVQITLLIQYGRLLLCS